MYNIDVCLSIGGSYVCRQHRMMIYVMISKDSTKWCMY